MATRKIDHEGNSSSLRQKGTSNGGSQTEEKSSSVVSTLPIEISGNLHKQGRLLKKWKPRFFQIQGSNLYYFKNYEKKECLGFIDLQKCYYVGKSDAASFGFAFELQTWGRTHLLAARDEREAERWIKVMKKKMVPEARDRDKKGSKGEVDAIIPEEGRTRRATIKMNRSGKKNNVKPSASAHEITLKPLEEGYETVDIGKAIVSNSPGKKNNVKSSASAHEITSKSLVKDDKAGKMVDIGKTIKHPTASNSQIHSVSASNSSLSTNTSISSKSREEKSSKLELPENSTVLQAQATLPIPSEIDLPAPLDTPPALVKKFDSNFQSSCHPTVVPIKREETNSDTKIHESKNQCSPLSGADMQLSPPPSFPATDMQLPPPPSLPATDMQLPPPPSFPDADMQLPPPPSLPAADIQLPPPPSLPATDMQLPPPPSLPATDMQLPPPPSLLATDMQLPPPPSLPAADMQLPPPPSFPAADMQLLPPPSLPAADMPLPPPPSFPTDPQHQPFKKPFHRSLSVPDVECSQVVPPMKRSNTAFIMNQPPKEIAVDLPPPIIMQNDWSVELHTKENDTVNGQTNLHPQSTECNASVSGLPPPLSTTDILLFDIPVVEVQFLKRRIPSLNQIDHTSAISQLRYLLSNDCEKHLDKKHYADLPETSKAFLSEGTAIEQLHHLVCST